MRNISVFRKVLFVGLLSLAVGCASSTGEHRNDTGPAADVYSPDTGVPPALYRLSIVGWQSLKLRQGQQVVLQVRYTKNEESAANEAITFALRGASGGSTLSTYTAVTNSLGFAETTLTAGNVRTLFQVQATPPHEGVQPVVWDIEIIDASQIPTDATLAGTFSLVSKFEITGQFSGSNLADTLNLLEEFSDDPDDPGKFIVDLLVDQIKGQVENDIINQLLDLLKTPNNPLYQEANKLLENFPIVDDMKKIAADLSALARRFTIASRMISPAPQNPTNPMTVTHRLDTVSWTLDNNTSTYTFAQLGMSDPQVDNVVLTLTNGLDLSISEHTYDLKFGAFLLVGLNSLIIPQIDDQADSFADLMAGWVDCDALGQKLDDATNNLVGAGVWKGACQGALTLAGSYLEKQILKIGDDPSSLEIQGRAKLRDTNADGFYDDMSEGLWTGIFRLKDMPAVLGAGNTFTGTRSQ